MGHKALPKCATCGKRIAKGRAGIYCSERCRWRAYREAQPKPVLPDPPAPFRYSELEWRAVVWDIKTDAATRGRARAKLEVSATWYLESQALRRDKNDRKLLERAKKIIDQLDGYESLKRHAAVLLNEVSDSNLRRSGRNLSRQAYYDAVLQVWTDQFGLHRGFSRDGEGGPLVRYIRAAISPMFGYELSTESIREIIYR